jgi:hypothetical protein
MKDVQTDITGNYIDQMLARDKKSRGKKRTVTTVIDPETGAEVEQSELVSQSDDYCIPETIEKSIQVELAIRKVPVINFNNEGKPLYNDFMIIFLT